jgi:putative phage essential recombination function protein
MEKEKKLNESIISIRVKLQNAKLKKSGKNKFAGFDYFELSDFLPKLNELMLEEGVNDNFKITNDTATLTLIKGEEKQEYTMPFVMFNTPLNKNGQQSMQDIQYLGALNTYYKRYLYLNAFGVTDGEVIDGMNNNELGKVDLITKEQIEVLKELVEDIPAMLYYYKVDKIEELTYKQAEETIKRKSKK